jgi:uncharacterized membrane protein
LHAANKADTCQAVVTRRLLLALLLLPFACATSFAASLPQTGERVSGSIDLFDKPIPLPPGEWRVAAGGFGQAAGHDPGPYGAIGGVLLLRADNDQGEFLLIHANALPVREGWGQPAECAEGDVLFRSVGEERNLHNACSFVVALRRAQLLRSHLPALGGPDAATSLAGVLPPWALVAGFRVSDRRDMLDVRYGVAPKKPDPTAWFTGSEPDHAHRVIITDLGNWAQAARTSALAAMRDPANQVAAMPPLSQGTGSASEPAPQEQISALRLGLYKLATYRVPSTLFGLAVSSIAAGDIYLGAAITFWQIFTHSAVFLGNELAWEWPSPTPVMPLVGTPGGAASARYQALRTGNDDRIALAANSNQLPLSALAAHGIFQVDGKQIPLPTGGWTVLASASEAGVTGTILGQLDGTSLAGLVVIHSNPTKTDAILGPSAECGRRDMWFAVTRYDTPEDGFCTYGKRVMPMPADERAERDNKLWAGVAQQLAEQGVDVPPFLLMVGARARTQENFLDARYYFAPPRGYNDAALPPATLLAALQNWADLVQEPLELGVRGRFLPRHPRSMPWPWESGAVRMASTAQSHEPLTELAASGALLPATLDHQLAQADAAMADREQQRLSLWSRSLFKVATYRIASYIDTFAVQTLLTANPAQGVAVATTHAVFKPVLAYANEMYWARSSTGKAPAALLSADFPDIGTDR